MPTEKPIDPVEKIKDKRLTTSEERKADLKRALVDAEIKRQKIMDAKKTSTDKHIQEEKQAAFVSQQKSEIARYQPAIDAERMKQHENMNQYFSKNFEQDISDKMVAADAKTKRALGVPEQMDWVEAYAGAGQQFPAVNRYVEFDKIHDDAPDETEQAEQVIEEEHSVDAETVMADAPSLGQGDTKQTTSDYKEKITAITKGNNTSVDEKSDRQKKLDAK